MQKGSVHFIGIGGAGMSAIAAILAEQGVPVSGSDLKESRNTQRLATAGAEIFIGHRPDNVEGTDLVVYSSAIRDTNKEMVRARELGLEIIPRAMMLARLMAEREGIAVAGTHGKTTTTSMLAKIICDAGWDPTFIVGGELNDIAGNARTGQGRHLIAEADESDGSFLFLQPYGVIITNIEHDHHDFYSSEEQLKEYFRSFLERIRPGGLAVLNGDDACIREVAEGLETEIVYFGENENNHYRSDDVALEAGGSEFDLLHGEERLGRLRLRVPGAHNLYNALAAAAMALRLGVGFAAVRESLAGFSGVHRRFERVGEAEGIQVVDDYAHHPTEVKATLQAARQEGAERVVCIFQPHRYSRTAALWKDFGEALSLADLVILTEVYAAGENPRPGVNAKLILDALLEARPRHAVVYIPMRAELGRSALRYLRRGDLVLTMGAGDVTQCSHEILDALKAAG